MKTYNLSDIMKAAHAIQHSDASTTWAACLRLAWKSAKLAKKMRHDVCKFLYTKADGSLRIAYGTLFGVPATSGNRKPNILVQPYFDKEVDGWRSFRKGNLLKVIY